MNGSSNEGKQNIVPLLKYYTHTRICTSRHSVLIWKVISHLLSVEQFLEAS